MQVYANSNRLSIKTLLVFTAVLFIAFLPVSSFLFFLKNDAFVGYFPPKFFMSESLHAGYLPLWNPYINFGIPQYGDMSSGYWSPLTWLIAATVGYNAYTFTLELLLYILLAGIGMFQLAGLWHLDKRVKFIAGIAFMCSGYMVGHLQHFNWVSGAAMLPWCLWSYLLLLKKSCAKHILLAVVSFYFLASSAHPGISIAAIYFFIAILIFHLFNKEDSRSIKERVIQTSLSHLIFLPLLIILSSGMLIGYLDIIPHFIRGEKISLANSLLDPSNIKTWISAILPMATVKNNTFYNTDISMRNNYFSLTLLLFFLKAFISKKSSWQKFLLATGFIFALLAGGGIVKTIAYKFIPFIGYVRLNGEFTIFAILCFILFSSIALNKFLADKKGFAGSIKNCYYFIEVIIVACIIFGLYKVLYQKIGLLYNFRSIQHQNTIALCLKTMIDSISFYDCLWMQGVVQLILLSCIKRCILLGNLNLLKTFVIADLIFATLLNIPFTGVGMGYVAQVQALINKSPKGIPAPILQAVNLVDTGSIKQKEMIGDWSLYNKQIGVRSQVYYPIVLKDMAAYFEHQQLKPNDNYLMKPFIFVDGKKETSLLIKQFSPNKIVVELNATDSAQLILQQNHYPHWFYYTGSLKKEVALKGINFMAAPVAKGPQQIEFSFEPVIVKWAMLVSLVAFSIYVFLIGFFIAAPISRNDLGDV